MFSSGRGLEACIAADSSVTILRVFNQVTSRSEDYQVVCKRIKYSYGSLVGTDVTCAKTNGKFPFFWPWTGLGWRYYPFCLNVVFYSFQFFIQIVNVACTQMHYLQSFYQRIQHAPTVFCRQLNAHNSHASNNLNLNKLLFDNTVLWVIPMGYTMPSRKEIQTMTGNNFSPSSLQCRHLQKIVEISLPNSWKAYRSSWEFFFQILHLTKKIRTVPVSQVASSLLVPLKVNKIYLQKKRLCKWDKLHNCTTFHSMWKNVFPCSRIKSLKFWKVWTFSTFHVQSKTIT